MNHEWHWNTHTQDKWLGFMRLCFNSRTNDPLWWKAEAFDKPRMEKMRKNRKNNRKHVPLAHIRLSLAIVSSIREWKIQKIYTNQLEHIHMWSNIVYIERHPHYLHKKCFFFFIDKRIIKVRYGYFYYSLTNIKTFIALLKFSRFPSNTYTEKCWLVVVRLNRWMKYYCSRTWILIILNFVVWEIVVNTENDPLRDESSWNCAIKGGTVRRLVSVTFKLDLGNPLISSFREKRRLETPSDTFWHMTYPDKCSKRDIEWKFLTYNNKLGNSVRQRKRRHTKLHK